MKFTDRLRNLWKLSEYNVRATSSETTKLVRDIVTIKPKAAMIIPEDQPDPFSHEGSTD